MSFSTSSTLEVSLAYMIRHEYPLILIWTYYAVHQHFQYTSSDTKCFLQIFKLDFSTSSQELPVAGQPVTAPERFHRLSWNAFVMGTPEQEKYPVMLLTQKNLY